MRDALAILDEAEARLAPLSLASNLAWWESQVEATEENAERRDRAELAWSDALADRELFAAVEARASSGANGEAGAEPRSPARPHAQTPAAGRSPRAGSSSSSRSVDLRFSRHRGYVGGVEVEDTEIKRILRRERRPGRASRGVGGVEDGRRRGRRRRPRARAPSERGRALPRSSRLVRAFPRDRRARREQAVDTLAEARSRHRRAVRALEGRARRETRRALRLPSPSFVRGTTRIRSSRRRPPTAPSTSTRSSRGRTSSRSRARTFEGIGFDVEGILARSDLYPRDGKNQHAFCIDVDRGGDVRILANTVETATRWTRCSTNSDTASTTSATATTCRGSCARRISSRPKHPRSSRRPLRRREWLELVLGASRPRSPILRAGWRRRGQSSCSSSRAGCS